MKTTQMSDTLKAVSITLRAAQSLESVLKKDIEAYGINTTEFGVLEYLYHKGPQPMQNIGNKLLMANSSITYVIDRLSDKTYISRLTDDKDKRKTNIHLTEAGSNFFESIFPNHKKKVNDIFSVLSNEELDQLMTLLKKVGYHSQSIAKKGL